jgi:deoxyribonuclease IV
MSLLGVHCSVSGGLSNAFIEAKRLGIDTFQIFTRNQRQWKAKPVGEDESELFKKTWKEHPEVKVIFSHASYLINLGSADPELYRKSIDAITEELIRCEALGLSYAVLHPGASGSNPEDETIKRISSAVKEVMENTKGSKVKLLLENTAGQGSSIGRRFEQLAEIMSQTGSSRIGTCFDTCHAFVSGYDIRTEKGFASVMKDFDKIVGLKNLNAIHMNDSKGDLNSRLDRHENIGQGKLGKESFQYIMNNFKDIPKVLETPKEEDWDAKNLAVLRKLVK